MKDFMKRFVRDEEGASLVEYTVLIALVTIGVIVTINSVGGTIITKWKDLDTNLKLKPA